MQHAHHTPAAMTGDETFPTHLMPGEAAALLMRHSLPARLQLGGRIIITEENYTRQNADGSITSHSDEKQFTATADGLFRAAPILMFLGY